MRLLLAATVCLPATEPYLPHRTTAVSLRTCLFASVYNRFLRCEGVYIQRAGNEGVISLFSGAYNCQIQHVIDAYLVCSWKKLFTYCVNCRPMDHTEDHWFYLNFSSKTESNISDKINPVYVSDNLSKDTFFQESNLSENCSTTAALNATHAGLNGSYNNVTAVTFPPLAYIYVTVTVLDILVFIIGVLGNVLVLLVISR